MTKSSVSKLGKSSQVKDEIAAYSKTQSAPLRKMCDLLRTLIDSSIAKATSKVWHGSPVWFIDDNPVVGYITSARSVNLLFWNGQAFNEPGLQPVGKYGAAQAVFADENDIDPKLIRRWLQKAKSDVFDSKAFFKTMRERGRATDAGKSNAAGRRRR